MRHRPDIVEVGTALATPPPPNVEQYARRYIATVYRLPKTLLISLNLQELVALTTDNRIEGPANGP